MRKLWIALGRIAFWFCWPALWVYFHFGSRTRAVITCQDSVLMVRGWFGAGKWSLPGGGLRLGEDPKQGALREVYEETGLRLSSDKVHELSQGKARDNGMNFHYIGFWAELESQLSVKPQRFEIVEVAWVPIVDINGRSVSSDAVMLVGQWQHKR